MEMEWNFIVRFVCVAGLCGTIIGLDREYRVKDAGFAPISWWRWAAR